MDIPDVLPSGQYVVYALVDPTDQVVYYVGQTGNPKRRLEQHLAARHHQGKKGDWLRRLGQKGEEPFMRILELVTGAQAALAKEREWICYFLEQNMPLFNFQAQPGRNNERSRSALIAEARRVQTDIEGAPPLVAVRLPDGGLGVTLRSLCELLGIDRVGQAQRIRRNPALTEAVREVIIDTPGGPQQAEILLNWAIAIWSVGLHSSRMSEIRQAAIQLLQRSAFATIQQAFTMSEDDIPTSETHDSVVNQIRQEFSY